MICGVNMSTLSVIKNLVLFTPRILIKMFLNHISVNAEAITDSDNFREIDQTIMYINYYYHLIYNNLSPTTLEKKNYNI